MKANIFPIILDHLRTLVDARTKRILWWDVVTFYLVPLVLGLIAIKYAWHITNFDVVLGAIALITGLLFNLLVLLFDSAARAQDETGDVGEFRRQLIRELQANVTYAVLVALVATGFIGAIVLAGTKRLGSPWSAIVLFALAHFLLVLAQILKRVRAVFLSEYLRQTPAST